RARPLGGALQGALADRVALAPHRESRAVHHDEHVLEPAAGLAHQIRQRTLLLTEGEHAGRARVDAELVLDREAAHVVARAERAVGIDEHLGPAEPHSSSACTAPCVSIGPSLKARQAEPQNSPAAATSARGAGWPPNFGSAPSAVQPAAANWR